MFDALLTTQKTNTKLSIRRVDVDTIIVAMQTMRNGNGASHHHEPLVSPDTHAYGSIEGSDPFLEEDDDEEYLTGQNNGIVLQSQPRKKRVLSLWSIACILSTAFSYGCILTTLFLITLPVECERIHMSNPKIPKSVALGAFVSIAGITQLVSPFVGMLSDSYQPPTFNLGKRLPYHVLGGVFTVLGLLGQGISSYLSFWLRYSVAFFLHMVGLNIQYAMMLALIPDQIPKLQTGVANGILALLLVTGSLFGFGLFHSFLISDIQSMYAMYTIMVIVTSILTFTFAHDRDVQIAQRRHGPSLQEKVTPYLLFRSMLYDPMRNLNWKTFYQSYTIDTSTHHDFFVVTVSRLFYYCGMSVQTFFLYFVHDIIHVDSDPEAAVAALAILGQCSGAFVCYPVGWMSDHLCGGNRRVFVYLACAILLLTTLATMFATSMHDMVILSLILGAANGMYLTMDTSLAVDTLPHHDHDYYDGHNEHTPLTASIHLDSNNAQLLGVWGVAAFLGSALGPMIGGPLLYAFGHQSSAASDSDDEAYSWPGYAVILSLSSFYFLCSAFSLTFLRARPTME